MKLEQASVKIVKLCKRNMTISCLVFFTLTAVCQEQKVLDSSNFKSFIKSLPSFTMYGDNYFVTGTSINEKITSDTSDAKFVLGFKQRLTNLVLPWDTFIFFRYRQKAFWDVYKESFPFRETNYNPSLGLAKLGVGPNGIKYGIWFAFEHESNGRDGLNSRSWNFFSLEYIKPYGTNWQLRIKAWLPFGDLSNNEEIVSFRGLFSVGGTYRAGNSLFFDLHMQPAYDIKLRGHLKLGVSFKISKKSNQFVYLQYFGGYSEDLIDFNQSVNNLRVGISFKDLFANFSK